MDVLESIQNIESINEVNLTEKINPEEIVHNDIVRIHLFFIIIGLFFTLFMVLL